MEHGQLLDVVQPSGFLRQLHDRAGRAKIGHFGAHERLVGRRFAVAGENRLKMIGNALFREHLLEFLRDLTLVGGFVVHADVELLHAALVRALDLIHREIGVFLERGHIVPVLGVPRHAARNADSERVAVRQHNGRMTQTALEVVQVAPELCAAVVAVEQHHELIARQTAANRVVGHAGTERVTGFADIAVAGVVTVDVVQLLEVVKVEHHERRVAQTRRGAEHILADAVERLAVVKAGQHIIVALVLDAQALLGRACHVLKQADLRPVLGRNAQPDIAHGAVLLRNAEHAAAVLQAEALAFRHEFLPQLLKFARGQRALRLFEAEHGEEVAGRVDRGIRAQLVAGQLDARHVHDAQELGRGVDDAPAEVGDGGCEAVDLLDAGVRQVRNAVRRHLRGGRDLLAQTHDRFGQAAACEQTARQTHEHSQQHGQRQASLHAARKLEQLGRGNRADEHPVAPLGEGRIAAVRRERRHRRIIAQAAEPRPAAVFVLHIDGEGVVCAVHVAVGGGRHHTVHGHDAVLRGFGGIGEEIRAAAVILKLGRRQKALHVARQHLHADDAVDRAVRQNERLRVRNDRVVVVCQRVALGGPAAVIGGVQAFVVLLRPLVGQTEKVILLSSRDRKARLPVFARGKAHPVHQLRRCTLKQHVSVLRRGRRGRVEVADVEARQGLVLLFGQAACVQHDIHARHALFAQRVHHLLAHRLEKRNARLVRAGEF